MISDDLFHDGGLGQRRDVAKLVFVVGGNLAEDAAHDFAGTGLGQSGTELRNETRGLRLQ